MQILPRLRRNDGTCPQFILYIVIAGDHLNEKYFPNPDQYDPSRHLGAKEHETRGRVLPFSTGNHRCTGSMLGELMALEMVSYWISNLDMEVVNPEGAPYCQAIYTA